jgi:hypothetical protein
VLQLWVRRSDTMTCIYSNKSNRSSNIIIKWIIPIWDITCTCITSTLPLRPHVVLDLYAVLGVDFGDSLGMLYDFASLADCFTIL